MKIRLFIRWFLAVLTLLYNWLCLGFIMFGEVTTGVDEIIAKLSVPIYLLAWILHSIDESGWLFYLVLITINLLWLRLVWFLTRERRKKQESFI